MIKIGHFKDGKEIIIEENVTRWEFRNILQNLLTRDLERKTRFRIGVALKTPLTAEEKIAEIQENMCLETW
jgi:hypothetical protein